MTTSLRISVGFCAFFRRETLPFCAPQTLFLKTARLDLFTQSRKRCGVCVCAFVDFCTLLSVNESSLGKNQVSCCWVKNCPMGVSEAREKGGEGGIWKGGDFGIWQTRIHSGVPPPRRAWGQQKRNFSRHERASIPKSSFLAEARVKTAQAGIRKKTEH